MLNPYTHASIWDFLNLFFQRMISLIIHRSPLASDELQVLTLAMIAASCALVGVFLIYRQMTMQANALSHSILLGIALTYLIMRAIHKPWDLSTNFHILLITALLTGFITTLLTHLIVKLSRLQHDAAIGLVFTSLLALGILLISLFSKNAHIGVELIMGNVDALHLKDLKTASHVLLLNGFLVIFFFGGLKISTFDPTFSYLRGLPCSFYSYLMIFLLSVASIGSFRAVGVVLVLSLFMVPPLIAKQYAKTLATQILLAMFIGVSSAILGVALSRHMLSIYHLPLSTGGLTVLVLYALFFCHYFFVKFWRQLKRLNTLKKQPRLN